MTSIKSPAKVNLTLDILDKDSSGYHKIQTILHEVPELFDELTFEPLDTAEIIIECDHPDVPKDDSNTIIKAAKLLQAHATKRGSTPLGAHITLTKSIPLESGLGGASSNAATTLKALNDLWQLNLTTEGLTELAAEIGMDVPFFIHGGTALGTHYGEKLTKLPSPNIHIEIIDTKIKISTKDAYTNLDPLRCGGKQDQTERLLKLLKNDPAPTTAQVKPLLHNDFESQFFGERFDLGKKYQGAHLTGSGGALFRVVS